MSLETARLSCDPAGKRLWIGYSALGEIHAYTPDGTLLWITRLERFQNPGLLERHGGVIGAHPSAVSQPFELITHLSYLSGGLLVVEVQSRRRAGSDDISHRVYVLDAHTGEGKGVVEGYGVIGGGWNRAVLYREEPFPQFSVFPVGGMQ
jgi:hypothetical protein